MSCFYNDILHGEQVTLGGKVNFAILILVDNAESRGSRTCFQNSGVNVSNLMQSQNRLYFCVVYVVCLPNVRYNYYMHFKKL